MVPERIKKNHYKMKELECSQAFPYENYMLSWKQEFLSNLAQTYAPTPIMLQMKFDYDPLAGLRDIYV